MTLHIADNLSHAPLLTTLHKQIHEKLVYCIEIIETDDLPLSSFYNVTTQEIRVAAITDPEQIILQSLVDASWPNDKSTIPESACPYWSVCDELTSSNGLLFKEE